MQSKEEITVEDSYEKQDEIFKLLDFDHFTHFYFREKKNSLINDYEKTIHSAKSEQSNSEHNLPIIHQNSIINK